MQAEVVITGLGLVTPLGADAPSSAAAWRAGAQAARRPIDGLDGTCLVGSEAAQLPPFDAAARLGGRRMLKYMSEAAVLGCVAAREAAEGAQLRKRFAPERVGLYAATGLAAASVQDVLPMLSNSIGPAGEFSFKLLGEKGLGAANPLLSFKILANMPPCLVSVIEGVKGPNLIFNPWEGQGGAALLEAWRAVRGGEADAALAGAADNAAHAATFVFLRSSGLLSPAEFPAAASAYVVLERKETALRDQRQIFAAVDDVELRTAAPTIDDPLSSRLGRTYAAAPAAALVLAALCGGASVSVCGVDAQRFTARLRRSS